MWFIEDMYRFSIERDEISRLEEKETWLLDVRWSFFQGKLGFFASIKINDEIFQIKLIYPNLYPALPPSILPQDKITRWSEHQYGAGGELCLEWGPDNWDEKITGADMLRSALKLLGLENPHETESNIPTPSRHELSLGQELRTSGIRLIVNKSLIDQLKGERQKNILGKVNIALLTYLKSSIAFITSIEYSKDDVWINTAVPKGIGKRAHNISGHFHLSNLFNKEIDSLTATSLLEMFQLSPDKLADQTKLHLFLIFSSSKTLHLLWLSEDKIHKIKSVEVDDSLINERLGDRFSNIIGKKVGIIGLGSAGSKVALSLARSGVENFYLVDHDVFLPENICRHELGWEYVGQHKVDGVKDALEMISSDVKVSTSRHMLDGQEASAGVDRVLTNISECDLIIDTSATSGVFNLISSIAVRSKKPFIWMEIFAGSVGGFIARYRPGREPDPKIMRLHFLNFANQKGGNIPISVGNYLAEIDNGITLPATDADVSVISTRTVQMAIDVLIGNDPSIFPQAMYLIGLSKGWIFEAPFHTYPLDFSEVEELSESRVWSEDKLSESVAFLKEILDKHTGDVNSA